MRLLHPELAQGLVELPAPMKVAQLSLDLKEFPSEQPFLISPLAKFSAFGGGGLVPLPDIDDGKDDQPTSRNCQAAGCPLSCNCAPTNLFLSGPPAASSIDSSLSIPTATSDMPTNTPVERRTLGGLSLTAPRDETQGPSRSRSLSSPHPSRSLGRDSSRSPSPLAAPPSAPASGGSFRQEVQHSSPLAIPNSREPERVLRTRLHDLLYDPGSPSSLPNMHITHFPASFTRETHIPQASTPSGSISSSSRRPLPLQPAESLPPIVTTTPAADSTSTVSTAAHSGSASPVPSTPTSANPSKPIRPTISRASSAAAAWALEQEKERRKGQEKERQREDPSRSPRNQAGSESERPQAHQGSVPSTSSVGLKSLVSQTKPVPSVSNSPSPPVKTPPRDTPRAEPSRVPAFSISSLTAGSRPADSHLNISLSQSHRGTPNNHTPRQIPSASLHSSNTYFTGSQRYASGGGSKGKIPTAMAVF